MSCSLMFKDFNADKCINMIFIFCFQTFCGCCFNWFQSKAQFVDFSFSHFYSNLITKTVFGITTFFLFLLRKKVHTGMYQPYWGINRQNDRSPVRLHQPKSPDNCRHKMEGKAEKIKDTKPPPPKKNTHTIKQLIWKADLVMDLFDVGLEGEGGIKDDTQVVDLKGWSDGTAINTDEEISKLPILLLLSLSWLVVTQVFMAWRHGGGRELRGW